MHEQFIRGSEWRRWDLHIHTPFTRKNKSCSTNTPSPLPARIFYNITPQMREAVAKSGVTNPL